jgi:hypothetical protein
MRTLRQTVILLTLQVPLVEQELLTLPEHLNSHTVVNGVHVAQCLVFCVVSWESLFVHLAVNNENFKTNCNLILVPSGLCE